jgi:multiple sugar transport system ATP-binding protein
MASVDINGVTKSFGNVEVIHGIDIAIANEEFVVLVGPSGCGKTTLLRMIAGLEQITDGEIAIGDKVVNELPPKDRDIAMVFQNYALYPHMTVWDNMAFSLKMRRANPATITNRVNQATGILELMGYLDRYPRQLSGGQRQRVAMGRAIVRNPKVFLFDEPLSNLDAKLRVQMRTEIKKVHQQVRTTTVYVTHDQVEAMTLADRVVVMNGGRIEQIGTPHELYHSPKTRFVAGFIGSPAMNFLPCTLAEASGALAVRLADGLVLPVPAERSAAYRAYVGRSLVLGLRPEHITETRAYAGGAEFTMPVDVVEPMGMETMVYFIVDSVEVCARCSPEAALGPSERMRFMAEMRHMHLIDPENDRVIEAPQAVTDGAAKASAA